MTTTSSRVMPVGSLTSNHHFEGLDPDSYTAHRLKHASPEHLHLTTRRFFIGPIPEGWLNSNRKSWYKRRLELSSYSSRKASFDARADHGSHHRTTTGLDGPSTAARMSFSFPQPEDVDDNPSESDTTQVDEDDESEDEERETRQIEPVSTHEVPQILGITDAEDGQSPKKVPVAPDRGLDGTMDPSRLAPKPPAREARSLTQESFVTARQEQTSDSREPSPIGLSRRVEDIQTPYESDTQRPSASNRNSFQPGRDSSDIGETGSREPLLPYGKRVDMSDSPKSAMKTIQHYAPAPVEDDGVTDRLGRSNTGVRFKVSEGVANRQHRIGKKVDRARERVTTKSFRRNTLREGTIVKMEKMLVKIDVTMQPVPDEFDENESIKIETKPIEKWREFMVVARKSKKQDAEDFRLQIYKTRVIPEIDDENTKKKPTREIRLDPKTTHVNLYSSLDKTVVIWHPYKKGTRIIIMRPSSTAHSVEWYTFLRDAMGWNRPATLEVNVPDLDVSLRLEKPFEGLEVAGLDAADEETALARTIEAEQAVAGKIISNCMEMLHGDSEWTSILKTWDDSQKIGLAWKRYDRLEWIHGIAEQKMYGSMAMQNSHDLELRPKEHYPTITHGKKGVQHEEPAPVEGFLIRLTSQKGVHKRLGKAFYKRLYFSTQNEYLIFNRPAKATPPHPPRLATISGRNIPSSHEIVEKTPMMYDIEPFKLKDGRVSWLSSNNIDSIRQHDVEAIEEARRNIANLTESDGFIHLSYIKKVRKIHWGASPMDEVLEPGSESDVDFHQDVNNTRGEDGTTTEIDDDRVLELVLDNDLVIRLQAYNVKTRDEWIQRLRKLVKYWKLRTAGDMDILKSVRHTNLTLLNIDEEMEAQLGQFGRKWEVSRSEASPELYNMCGISSCRTIALSGLLYRKARRRSTFQRCGVILSGGKLLIFQASLRRSTGEQVKHIHQDKQEVIDLRDCYIYSGLMVEDDLLYQNRTFDANHPGLSGLPRVYLEDGWTSSDSDVMTCFVIWMNRRKGWFRATSVNTSGDGEKGTTQSRFRRVRQLGVPGRAMVFKCRSRVERDHWVLSIANEIERIVEMEAVERGNEGEIRFDR